jgi:hypothetical protein
MNPPGAIAIRQHLLAFCQDRYAKAMRGNDPHGDRRRVRDGVLAAERVILAVAADGVDADAYLALVLEALDREWTRLAADDADDEDHWAAGAVRTIANEATSLAGPKP